MTRHSLLLAARHLGIVATEYVRRGRGKGSAEARGDEVTTQPALFLLPVVRVLAVDVGVGACPLDLSSRGSGGCGGGGEDVACRERFG